MMEFTFRYLLGLDQVEVNIHNKTGQTALHYASSKNHPEVYISFLGIRHCIAPIQDRSSVAEEWGGRECPGQASGNTAA